MQSAIVGCKGASQGEIVEIPLSSIRPGGFGIRSQLGESDDLKNSILQFGLLNPILVRRVGSSSFEVVAGNRRLKALLELGQSTTAAIIVEANDRECYEIFLAENLQRESLDPLDQARAFYRYISSKSKRGLGYGSISELARRVGKSQEYISNRIGLLRLRESTVRELLYDRKLTVSHIEELSSISDNPRAVEELSRLISSQRISVRVLERAVQLIKSGLSTSRALELAKIESELRLGSMRLDCSQDNLDEVMKRSKRILEATLSYLDDSLPELEQEPAICKYWVENVRLPVHKAIDGAIVCEKRLLRMKARKRVSANRGAGPRHL